MLALAGHNSSHENPPAHQDISFSRFVLTEALRLILSSAQRPTDAPILTHSDFLGALSDLTSSNTASRAALSAHALSLARHSSSTQTCVSPSLLLVSSSPHRLIPPPPPLFLLPTARPSCPLSSPPSSPTHPLRSIPCFRAQTKCARQRLSLIKCGWRWG